MSESNLKKYHIFEPLLLALMVGIGMVVGFQLKKDIYPESADDVIAESKSRENGKVEQLLRYIETRYVDEKDGVKLTEAAIGAITDQLDPHSRYIPPAIMQDLDDEMSGSYVGVGLQEMWIGDSLYVSGTLKNSSAEEEGLKNGWRVITVNDSIAIDGTYPKDTLHKLLSGPLNSRLTLQLQDWYGDTINAELVRKEVPLPSIDVSYEINEAIGVIRINRFSGETYREFMIALEHLKEENIEDLIIDLRDNPGGYLQETVKILSQLVDDENQLLVYTEGINSKRADYKSSGRKFFSLKEIAILINEGSASASEIMAGALQDLDRALIVGRRSFGKGLVQEQYPLMGGAAIRLTSARYYTPSGRLIQRSYEDKDDYSDDLDNRDNTGEYVSQDSIVFEDTTLYFTVSGREVHGGGGVMPEVFVPSEIPFRHSEWADLKYFINQFVLLNMKKWSSLDMSSEEYIESYSPKGATLDELVDYLRAFRPMNDLNDQKKLDFLNENLKASIGGFLYNDKAVYFKVLYGTDDDIEKALEILNKDEVNVLLGRGANLE